MHAWGNVIMGGLVGRKKALAMRRVDDCECLLSSKCDDVQDERSGPGQPLPVSDAWEKFAHQWR